MPDREKILKGLEMCQYSSKSHCDGCPYDYNARGYCNECTADLASDVLSLLKEQEEIINRYQREDGEPKYLKGGEVGMIKKIRPIATVDYSFGNDGRDSHHYIAYRCPTCGIPIPWYKYATACDKCGTFYDWGKKEPEIEITRSVKWNE